MWGCGGEVVPPHPPAPPVTLFLLGSLIVLTEGSAVAPFIYALF